MLQIGDLVAHDRVDCIKGLLVRHTEDLHVVDHARAAAPHNVRHLNLTVHTAAVV
jgi:hypothetical protein